MKFLMIPYIILAMVFMFLGVTQSNRNKTAWGMILFLILMICAPIVAKFIGLL